MGIEVPLPFTSQVPQGDLFKCASSTWMCNHNLETDSRIPETASVLQRSGTFLGGLWKKRQRRRREASAGDRPIGSAPSESAEHISLDYRSPRRRRGGRNIDSRSPR